ncbi:hypothetical protein [Dictyobacter halimunensis]|uniref:hypothetical protein n=1 Tax=Dictyobacter halimunensis TaxID=3026934 RepID=UPI003B986267
MTTDGASVLFGTTIKSLANIAHITNHQPRHACSMVSVDCPRKSRRETIEAVEGTWIGMQFGGNTSLHQTCRILNIFVAQQIGLVNAEIGRQQMGKVACSLFSARYSFQVFGREQYSRRARQ